jgi:hypothetical protein
MRNHRLVPLLFAAAMATASGLAVASPAHANNAIIQLVSGDGGECLQPAGGSSALGEAIVEERCNGSSAQQWTETTVPSQSIFGSNQVHLVSLSNGLCLDARGGAANGTPIEQWVCDWISNENWSFGINNNELASRVSHTYSYCVTTPGAYPGAAMDLQFCGGYPAQIWSRPIG